jgi:hypothetical protein
MKIPLYKYGWTFVGHKIIKYVVANAKLLEMKPREWPKRRRSSDHYDISLREALVRCNE